MQQANRPGDRTGTRGCAGDGSPGGHPIYAGDNRGRHDRTRQRHDKQYGTKRNHDNLFRTQRRTDPGPADKGSGTPGLRMVCGGHPQPGYRGNDPAQAASMRRTGTEKAIRRQRPAFAGGFAQSAKSEKPVPGF